jgi:hypothetical protein
MKLSPLIWFTLTGISVVAVGGFFLKKISENLDAENQQNLEDWVDKLLADSLGRKLSVSPSLVMKSLHSPDDNGLIRDISSLLGDVELIFKRQLSGSSIRITISAQYTDGTSFSANMDSQWDNLPSTLRREFLASGSREIRVPWHLSLVETQKN